MYRSLKFKLNATESGVAGGRLADLMRTKTWKDKWSIFSITLLFHLSIHFVHQIDVRRVAFSSSPLVCFCIRNFTFAMSSSVCVNRYPFAVSTTEICQERKIKNLSPSSAARHHESPQSNGEPKTTKTVLLWNLEDPQRQCVCAASDSISHFFLWNISPHAKCDFVLAFWIKINRNMMRTALSNSTGIKSKDTAAPQRHLRVQNNLTFHFFYLCYALRFVLCVRLLSTLKNIQSEWTWNSFIVEALMYILHNGWILFTISNIYLHT